jgi:hypothetical protein
MKTRESARKLLGKPASGMDFMVEEANGDLPLA